VSDNEHTFAPLRHTEILCVENCVGEPIPEFFQHPEEGTKIPSSVTRQNPRNVFPYNPTGAKALRQGSESKHEVAARISQSLSESCDAEGLARGSSDEEVNGSMLCSDLREVAQVRNVGVVVCEDTLGERLDLGDESALPAKRLPGDGRSLYSRTHTPESHIAPRPT
jgi:hypothetical protein